MKKIICICQKNSFIFDVVLGPAASEEVLSTQFRAALQVLSSSTSGQENFRDNEFVITEKIKKLLVRFTYYLLPTLVYLNI